MANAVQKVTGPRLMLQHKYLAASQGAQKSLEPPEAPVIGCRRRLAVPRMRRGLSHIDLKPLTPLPWTAVREDESAAHASLWTSRYAYSRACSICMPAALWFISLDLHQEVCLKVSVCKWHSGLWFLLFITGNIIKYHSKRYNYCLAPHGTALCLSLFRDVKVSQCRADWFQIIGADNTSDSNNISG